MKKILLLLVSFVIFSDSFAQNVLVTDRLQEKINTLNPLDYTRILILLKDRVDIDALDSELYANNTPIDQRAQIVITTLRNKAEQTQSPLLNYLNSEKDFGKVRQYIPYWITNMIFAEVNTEVILNLMKRSDIEVMDYDAVLDFDKPYDVGPAPDHNTESVETGLKVVKADLMWALGFTGAGRTVMHIDTGVDVLHPALGPRWWGNNGRAWYHAWFDPISPFSTQPFDCGSHGTHTMGTMTGRNSATGDTVGIAPDARWMAAGITDCPGSSNPSMNIAAYQWAMDPDTNAVTMDMPDVISCSWRDPSATDECTNSIYRTVLTAVEAAGIAVVFSAGNSGPGASTITPPKNINIDSVNTFCVGNVNGNTAGFPISSSSSRGPSLCGGTGNLLIKPEVCAPGTSIRSTTPNNSYGVSSGTSMASPHVAGCIALLKQVAPGMTGKQLKAILYSTATDLGTAGEDNSYGNGLVNVYEAFLNLGVFPLNAFNLQTPNAGTTVTTLPNSTATVTLNWDTSATGAQYKWIFGSPTTNPRLLSLSASSNSLTMTLGQLDNLLANIGVAQGDSLVGQWDVWSYRIVPVDSMKASNGPRSITLKRGAPALLPFSLVSPPNNSTVLTLVSNTSLVNINWTKSGQAVNYKWIYASPNFSSQTNVKLSVVANSSGLDSNLTFRNSQLDSSLAGIGVNVGDSTVGQWRVYGYSAGDSLASGQTYNITMKRGIPPTVTSSVDSLVVSVMIGGTATRNLTIGNTGQFPLNWAITESSSSLDNLNVKSNFVINEELNLQQSNLPKGYADVYLGEEVTDGMGGPDAFGYRWIDSDEPGGPVFNWYEISAIGTQITSWTSGTGDDGSVIVPIPFTFNYYGNDYTQLKICTNGWIGFDIASTSNAYSNVAIPATGEPNNAIYPFWDDHDLRTSGQVFYYYDAPNSRFVIQYKDVPHFSTGGPYTYQVMIHADGRIYFQYLNMSDPVNSATIGLENSTGTTALQVAYNAAYMHNNLAIKLEKGLAWVDEDPSSGTITPSGNQNVAVNFNSTGLAMGSYEGYLNIGSNDPLTPNKSVRIKLNVGPVGIQNTHTGTPTDYLLAQNYPNPFNPSTNINFSIPKEGLVTMKVYDILGKEVMTLVNENKPAGNYIVTFKADNLSSGAYYYRLESGDFKDIKRMIILK